MSPEAIGLLIPAKAPLLVGLKDAPDHMINGIADMHFLGVNSQIVPYREGHTDCRKSCWRVPYTVTFPTGALPYMLWQMIQFAREHHLMQGWHYDAARCPPV